MRKPLPDAAAGPINNLVHWGYGVGWGALYGLMAGSLRQVRLPLGPFFGTGVWLSAHVAYGSATAAAFELMAGADARSRGRMA